MLERVLFTWSVRQPASGYVQGQHDVLLPLFLVFLADRCDVPIRDLSATALDKLPMSALQEVEADCFGCLVKVLGELADNYTEGQPGLQRAAVLMRSAMTQAGGGDMIDDMDAAGVDIVMVVARWIGCLMVRELPILHVIRLWDTLIAESVLAPSGSLSGACGGIASFLVFFCSSFLLSHASELRDAEMDVLMAFVQDPPTELLSDHDLEGLISQAFVTRSDRVESGLVRCPDAPGSSLTTSASATPASTPRCSSQASDAFDIAGSATNDMEHIEPDSSEAVGQQR